MIHLECLEGHVVVDAEEKIIREEKQMRNKKSPAQGVLALWGAFDLSLP